MSESQQEFILTDQDFTRVVRIVGSHAGIALGPDKKPLVYARLARRLRRLGLRRVRDYIDLLGDEDSDEFTHFVNALTTNVTAFFREAHHFEFLTREFLGEVAGPGRPTVRIWSAGCSTGMEPYSIAIAVYEAMELHGPMDVEILATDLDSSVLETAREGVYPAEAIEPLSEQRRKRWFRPALGEREGHVRVSAALQALVTFRKLNLVGAWGLSGGFDVIFCRNTVIYFARKTQMATYRRFADQLRPGGLLVLGHSETLGPVADRFRSCGRTMHRRLG